LELNHSKQGSSHEKFERKERKGIKNKAKMRTKGNEQIHRVEDALVKGIRPKEEKKLAPDRATKAKASNLRGGGKESRKPGRTQGGEGNSCILKCEIVTWKRRRGPETRIRMGYRLWEIESIRRIKTKKVPHDVQKDRRERGGKEAKKRLERPLGA